MTKPTGNKRGRPPKQDIVAIKESRGVGRPKGTQAIINDYRDRMLNSPKSAKVLEAIFDAALDPENKNQAAAWKLILDRVAPVSAFDLKSNMGSSVPKISINITSMGKTSVEKMDDIIDVEDITDS